MRQTASFLLPLLAGVLSAQTPYKPVAHLTSQEPSQLPITRVSLYKNGVGFFEHAGRVTGNQTVTIDFTTAQLNDVLQSLTAIDLNGGRIAGAGYNSTTPLDQQLKALPFSLAPDADSVAFYNAIKGARVEVHSTGISITGRLLNIELRTTQEKDGQAATETRWITVVSDAGAVRTLQLTPATEVRLLDTTLHTDITRYLQLLADTSNQSLRRLKLQDNGEGTRDLRVSYISEMPIWKSTYRILFTDPITTSGAKQTATLQGWSVVDNTTGSDWLNVQLSLIAGAPQSFIQPLSVPYYSRRPEIPLPQEAQLSPQTHDSGEPVGQHASGVQGSVTDQTGASIPNATVVVVNNATGARISSMTDGSGNFQIPLAQAGQYRIEVSSPGFQQLRQNIAVGGQQMNSLQLTLNVGSSNQTVMVDASPQVATLMSQRSKAMIAGVAAAPMTPYEDAAANSIAPQTTTAAFDDFFAYTLAQPITIRKNESALVPILQTKVDAERVTLIDPQRRPLRALWITNTSNLTLDRGSFSIVEGGNFGGEGLLDPIHPKERRLLSYAADTAVRVSTESNLDSSRATSVTVSKGVLIFRTAEVAELEYLLHNAAPEPRTLILEHPRRQGFTLDSASGNGSPAPKPEETTASVYRFRILAAPGQTVRLHVGEKRLGTARYELLRSDDNQLTSILNESHHNPQLEAALQPILEARRRVADAQTALNAVNDRLNALRAEEDRQRQNITALKDADKSARNRFVHDLNATEDQIAAAQKDAAARDAELKASQQELANRITGLQLDQTL